MDVGQCDGRRLHRFESDIDKELAKAGRDRPLARPVGHDTPMRHVVHTLNASPANGFSVSRETNTPQ
jgi:hypothetical protein